MEKNQWVNYGDKDYLDNGGIQMRIEHPYVDESKFDISAVILTQNPENSNTMYASTYFTDSHEIDFYRNNQEFMESHGLSENSTIEEIALVLTDVAMEKGYDMPLFYESNREPVSKLELAHELQSCGIDVEDRLEELEKDVPKYRLLSRLQNDCMYVLDTCVEENGLSLESSEKHLWCKNAEEQIAKMQELYDAVSVKPEWLTQEDINTFAARFDSLREHSSSKELADKIEQIMYVRGEYDFGESDRIRWLEGLPNAFDLADSPSLLDSIRWTVADRIEKDLENGNVADICNYLNDQIAEMVEEDELIPVAESLCKQLKSLPIQGKENSKHSKSSKQVEIVE